MKKNYNELILQVKKELGTIMFWHIKADNFVDAHRQLGQKIKEYSQADLRVKLAGVKPQKLPQQLEYARQCRKFMEGKIKNSTLPSYTRQLLQEYLDCLDAWSEAVDIEKDTAFWLQNENVHCQTGAMRTNHDSVLFWHTEERTEDEEKHRKNVNIPCITEFDIKGVKYSTFMVPLVMPGTGFCWRNDYYHAVNSLYIDKHLPGGGFLSNVAAWLLWRGDKIKSVTKFLKDLTPFTDGYAMIVTRPGSPAGVAELYEFGIDKVEGKVMSDSPFEFFFFSNCSYLKGAVSQYEKIAKKKMFRFSNRIKRNHHILGKFKKEKNDLTVTDIKKLLTSRWGKTWSYVNKDTKMYIYGEAKNNGMDLYIGGGPPLAGEQENHIHVLCIK